MEKSIEWTNEKGASRRLDVYVKTADSLKKKWQRATSADIVSALAALPTEERLAVLAQVAPGVQATLDLVAERDKALRERDAAREERDEVRAAARESDAFGQSMQVERGDANRRVKQVETERDEALKWLAEIHRTIGRGDGHGAPCDTARCVIDAIATLRSDYDPDFRTVEPAVKAEPDSLKEHMVVAGSQLIGNVVIEENGTSILIDECGLVHMTCHSGSMLVSMRCQLGNILALAATQGWL